MKKQLVKLVVLSSFLVCGNAASAQTAYENAWADSTEKEQAPQRKPVDRVQIVEPMITDAHLAQAQEEAERPISFLANTSVNPKPIPSGSFSLGFPKPGETIRKSPFADYDFEAAANDMTRVAPESYTNPEKYAADQQSEYGTTVGDAGVTYTGTNTAYTPVRRPGGIVRPPGNTSGPPPIRIFTCANGYGWMYQAGSGTVYPDGNIRGDGPGTIRWDHSWSP